MKRTILRFCTMGLLATVSLTSCEQEVMNAEPIGTIPATVRDLTGLDGCGWVFELQDGTKLEFVRMFWCGTPPVPEEAKQDPLYNFEFVDGKQVRIAYEEMESYGSVCMVGKIVKITALKELN